MLNFKYIDTETHIVESEIKSKNKVVKFHVIDPLGYRSFSVIGEIAKYAASMVEEGLCALKIKGYNKVDCYSFTSDKFRKITLKVDGVETVLNYPSYKIDRFISDNKSVDECLIDIMGQIFNIEDDHIIYVHEEYEEVRDQIYNQIDLYSGDISMDEYQRRESNGSSYHTEVYTRKEVVGDVVKEANKITITYKDGQITILSDFTLLEEVCRISYIKRISESVYNSDNWMRNYSENIIF